MRARVIILSVSVGTPQEIEFNGKRIRTSIFKAPVDGRVAVRKSNIDGDEQSDLSVHGGENKAIYVYSHDYYKRWARILERPLLEVPQFGENLTIVGGMDEHVVIGSRYRIGVVEVTVTQPRIPCFKLGVRMNDQTFPQTFWATGHLGFYARVESEGCIQRGQDMHLIDEPDHKLSIRDLYNIVRSDECDDAMNALEVLQHLDDGWIRRLRQVGRATGSAVGNLRD